MKHKIIVASIIVVCFVTNVALGVDPSERDPANYIGAKKCKMCHKKPEVGEQFQKWVDGPHSKTYEVLASDEAKKVAAELGIDDPQSSGKCLKCHSTAYHWSEEIQTTAISVEEGVSCESCHGPGANYKKKSIMKDHAASIAGGMVYPATKSCTLCHNDQNPTWDPEKYTTEDGSKTGFDVKQAYEKIKHPNPNIDNPEPWDVE